MHISPDMLLFITLFASFLLILVGIVNFCNDLRRCRNKLNDRINALRIGKMLNHAGISRTRYLHKAKPLTIEKHLLVCKQCKTIDICDKCLEKGADIPEKTFCRNYRELIKYR